MLRTYKFLPRNLPVNLIFLEVLMCGAAFAVWQTLEIGYVMRVQVMNRN